MRILQNAVCSCSNVSLKPEVRASYEHAEQLRAVNSSKLAEDNYFYSEEEEECSSGLHRRRPSTPLDYTLAIDYTASKMIDAVIVKCKQFQCVSSLYKEESHELLSTLVGLHEILQIILGLPNLCRYQEVLEDIMLYSTKVFAFMEKLCCKQVPDSSHGVHKSAMKMSEYACRFYNQTVRLCEEYETVTDKLISCNVLEHRKIHFFSLCALRPDAVKVTSYRCLVQSDDQRRCIPARDERLSFGVITYRVPIDNVADMLLRKRRVHIPLVELDGKSAYHVELSYPRSWFSRDVAMSAKIESNDRGFSQTLQVLCLARFAEVSLSNFMRARITILVGFISKTLLTVMQAGRVKIEKGSWGWEEAQDTILITYDDLVVANVAAVSGSLLSYIKQSRIKEDQSPRTSSAQKYRTSIQIVGSSRIDLDLQNLFISGVKGRDCVYYKCFVNMCGREEVLGIYRYQQKQFLPAEGVLHIVGRGNQPGLRHVLVAIFSSLGFTPCA